MGSTSEPDQLAAELSRLLGRSDVQGHVNTFNPTSRSYAVGNDLWVKVATDDRRARSLDRWAGVAERLATEYAAPRLIDRLLVAGRPALVFERLAATAADQDQLGRVVPELLALTERLHRDADLRAAVRGDVPVTAGAALEALWGRRLREDLDLVDGSPESPGEEVIVQWRGELERLSDLARAHTELVDAPVHRDLWRENVLVDDERFWLIDWDGLSIGDPVVDDAVLLFDALGADPATWAAVRPPCDTAEAERFALCARFQLLDRAIDPLADNVELPVAGFEAVKEDKRAAAAIARSFYQRTWA